MARKLTYAWQINERTGQTMTQAKETLLVITPHQSIGRDAIRAIRQNAMERNHTILVFPPHSLNQRDIELVNGLAKDIPQVRVLSNPKITKVYCVSEVQALGIRKNPEGYAKVGHFARREEHPETYLKIREECEAIIREGEEIPHHLLFQKMAKLSDVTSPYQDYGF